MKKGFVLSMDVMLALVVSAVFVSSILYFITAPRLRTDKYLYQTAQDILTVSDKDGSIASALDGNDAQLRGFVASMPQNLCLEVTVYDHGGTTLVSESTGCQDSGRWIIARRAIVNATSDYTAEARIWLR